MMIRLIVVALFAGWAGLALAVDEGQGLQGNKVAAMTEQEPAPTAPAMGGQAAPAASAVPAAPGATTEPPGAMAPAAAPAAAEAPKSSIPLEKREGGDITQCLAAGTGSDKDVAACAEKYRPQRGGRGR